MGPNVAAVRKQVMKQVAAPLRKSGRLEQLLRATRLRGSRSTTAYQVVVPHATYSPWWTDDQFQQTWERVKDNTLVDIYRLYELWKLVEQASDLEGDIVEVGVWRGGSGATMAKRSVLDGTGATIHLCDTFRGVAKAGPEDADYVGGELADTSRAIVEQLVKELQLPNVRIHEGIFPDDTGDEVDVEALRLVHVDVDVYESARGVFEWAWPKLVPSGIVVFDDYGFYMQEGVTRYVNELGARHDLTLIHNLNGHAVIVKR